MRFKILLTFFILFFGSGLIIFSVDAATLKEINRQEIAQYNNAKSAYQIAIDTYKSARQDWLNTKDKYKSNKSPENTTAALEAGRNYIGKASAAMVGYLNLIKVKVESINAIENDNQDQAGIDQKLKEEIIKEINSDLDWLTNKHIELESMETKDELVAAAEDVNNHWNNIKAEVKRYTGEILAAKTEQVVKKLEEIQEKAEQKIDLLTAEGQDVSQLRQWLDSYERNLNTAQEKYDLARTEYRKIKSLSDADQLFENGHNFLKEADQYIRSAHEDLEKIVSELKKRKIGEKELSGTGILYVNGGGEAELKGEGTIQGQTDTDSVMTVTDNLGNAYVKTDGQGTKESISENTTLYKGFGRVRVTGLDIKVNIESGQLDLEAFGTGTVFLKGSGTYRVNKDGPEKEISATGVTLEIKSAGAVSITP